jgi:hypothetical protein
MGLVVQMLEAVPGEWLGCNEILLGYLGLMGVVLGLELFWGSVLIHFFLYYYIYYLSVFNFI